MDVNIRLDVRLPIEVNKGEKYFIASCPVLDVASQGRTENKAKSNLEEALAAFFISCIERGVLDAVLRDCGFKSAKRIMSVKRPPLKKKDFIDIPLYLLANQAEPNRCHA
jgi:predicted RNase H-like HicB family nuclease